MDPMPKMVPPGDDWPEALDTAIECFGSRHKAMVIAYLRNHPGSFTSEIAQGTGLAKATLQNQVDKLLARGVIVSDIPVEKRGRGRASRYSADSDRIAFLLNTLREYLSSEISTEKQRATAPVSDG